MTRWDRWTKVEGNVSPTSGNLLQKETQRRSLSGMSPESPLKMSDNESIIRTFGESRKINYTKKEEVGYDIIADTDIVVGYNYWTNSTGLDLTLRAYRLLASEAKLLVSCSPTTLSPMSTPGWGTDSRIVTVSWGSNMFVFLCQLSSAYPLHILYISRDGVEQSKISLYNTYGYPNSPLNVKSREYNLGLSEYDDVSLYIPTLKSSVGYMSKVKTKDFSFDKDIASPYSSSPVVVTYAYDTWKREWKTISPIVPTLLGFSGRDSFISSYNTITYTDMVVHYERELNPGDYIPSLAPPYYDTSWIFRYWETGGKPASTFTTPTVMNSTAAAGIRRHRLSDSVVTHQYEYESYDFTRGHPPYATQYGSAAVQRPFPPYNWQRNYSINYLYTWSQTQEFSHDSRLIATILDKYIVILRDVITHPWEGGIYVQPELWVHNAKTLAPLYQISIPHAVSSPNASPLYVRGSGAYQIKGG